MSEQDRLKKVWDNNGKFFGYPKCCIESFKTRAINILQSGITTAITKEQTLAANNTGFIPCINCSNKINSNEIKLEDLITNRICLAPFPDER